MNKNAELEEKKQNSAEPRLQYMRKQKTKVRMYKLFEVEQYNRGIFKKQNKEHFQLKYTYNWA